jgi:hypothetical protein
MPMGPLTQTVMKPKPSKPPASSEPSSRMAIPKGASSPDSLTTPWAFDVGPGGIAPASQRGRRGGIRGSFLFAPLREHPGFAGLIERLEAGVGA